MLDAKKERTDLFSKALEPSPELTNFRQGQSQWNSFIDKKDYSNPQGILSYNLWQPAQEQKMLEKSRNITGVGATALGGNNSIALQLARERNANEMAQNQAASYEDAIMRENDYYRGNALPYASFDTSKNLGLLNNSSNQYQFATQGYAQTAPKPFNWGALIGGALGVGSSLLGNPSLFTRK